MMRERRDGRDMKTLLQSLVIIFSGTTERVSLEYFVPSGSVGVGSYSYDEPASDRDDRLLRFADVPARGRRVRR